MHGSAAGSSWRAASPAGPLVRLAWPAREQVMSLFLPAFMIALVGFVESVSVAQSLAIKRGQRIDPNAELRSHGMGR